MGILERWQVTPEELDEIVTANPSLRGFMLGYVAEYKLRKLWFQDERVVGLVKYANHDRTRKGDLSFFYKGLEMSVEVKSLQTATIKKVGDEYSATFQCDASDKRMVYLRGGESVVTTCLVVGDFDLLAVNLFALTNEWRFAFAKNRDLPRSRYRGYTPEQRDQLLATLMKIKWPLESPFYAELYQLLDEIVQEGRPPGAIVVGDNEPPPEETTGQRKA
ncbi:MAG: restriction endonuclease [Anaerolineae bacterium]